MNSDSHFFKLGLFVIVGVLLIVGGVVVLGAGELFTKYVTVETATTESVDGLDVGAAVKYSGVTVGKVSKIQMAMWKYPSSDPAVMNEVRRYVWIEMQVRRSMLPAKSDEEMVSNFQSAVDAGLRVRLASSGLTGPTFMAIGFVNPKDYPVQPLPWKPEGIYLPSAPAAMAQIVSSIESIASQLSNANIGETIADTRKTINDADKAINGVNTAEIQKKAVALIDEANASAHRIHEILDDPKVSQAVADLPQITTPLRESLSRIDGIVHDPKVQQMIDNLNQTTASAAPSAAELRRTLKTLNDVLDSRQRDLELIITELRQILENGDTMVQDAKDNPSRLLFGNPPPHYGQGTK